MQKRHVYIDCHTVRYLVTKAHCIFKELQLTRTSEDRKDQRVELHPSSAFS